jgi:hypothetical protein
MKHVLEHYQLTQRKSTDAAKRRIDRHLTPFFAGRRMAAITTDLITRYATERLAERQRTPRSIASLPWSCT